MKVIALNLIHLIELNQNIDLIELNESNCFECDWFNWIKSKYWFNWVNFLN